MAALDLGQDVPERIRVKLVPPPSSAQTLEERLADLEVKIENAQLDASRLHTVVVKKQVELRQVEERAENKTREVRQLHAETLQVKPPPSTGASSSS